MILLRLNLNLKIKKEIDMALYPIGNENIFLKKAAALEKIENKDKKINEAKKYNHIAIQFPNRTKKDL